VIGAIVCNLGGLFLLGGMEVMGETGGLGFTVFPLIFAISGVLRSCDEQEGRAQPSMSLVTTACGAARSAQGSQQRRFEGRGHLYPGRVAHDTRHLAVRRNE